MQIIRILEYFVCRDVDICVLKKLPMSLILYEECCLVWLPGSFPQGWGIRGGTSSMTGSLGSSCHSGRALRMQVSNAISEMKAAPTGPGADPQGQDQLRGVE